ncbi:MAG: phosphatidylserine/phosphatidylglycerophosphate/cardiolipin synthase family protein [Nitrospiraceae bacterium]|nr:phosphatidylserine/phosphatidylglycerophosphate/cardiolipin synthase family protein [Nitrospiraceae bacterium]
MKRKAAAEEFAHPSYKWIGERRIVKNMQNWQISNFPGGIGFSFYNYSPEKALKVVLKVYREDGTTEFYIINTYYCGEWGDNWQKWQTHQLPLFPYESCHGRIKYIKFSYIIHKDGKSIPSQYDYKFATLDDFHRGWLDISDFHDPYFKTKNDYITYELNREEIRQALHKVNNGYNDLPIRPFFTRGNTWDPGHPIHEIHRHIDWVIERKRNDPKGRHFIQIAVFDFDNYHVAEHLIYAKKNGVEVECIGDWASVSSMNCTENIAKMRHAGIPVYGVVHNTPCNLSEGISSMHTKFIIFDGEMVHSSSYNLHFHLWGGNWENGLVYYSRDFALLYSNIYHAIRGGVIQRLHVNPQERYNLYYSFGSYYTPHRDYYRPQDAIITEIENAGHSIIVVMFDMDYLTGISYHNGHETDVVTALINARNRGVRVRIILNGMLAHTQPLPEPWDKDFRRTLKDSVKRLKDAWMECVLVYYRESIYSPLHHKFAVFDGYTVITESFNWYESSIYSDEVLSVIRDERVAMEFINEADRLCQSFRLGWE